MPKTGTSQKGHNKKQTSATAAGTSQSRARVEVRRVATAAAKKNNRQGGKLRKKLSRQQATETRDLLDAEFPDLRVETMLVGQQGDSRQCEGAATTTGFSAHVSEGSVQDLAGIMSALRTNKP